MDLRYVLEDLQSRQMYVALGYKFSKYLYEFSVYVIT